MESLSDKKRVRDSDDSTFNSPDSKRIRLDLLDSVDDSDEFTVGEHLDSFIKSFEDEISPHPDRVDQVSDSGESRPGLEFLLEASDDELGLPPTDSVATESGKVPGLTESGELGLFSWLDEQVTDDPNYDSFEYGFDCVESDVSDENNDGCNGEYVALDGLFDYTDLGFRSSDLSR